MNIQEIKQDQVLFEQKCDIDDLGKMISTGLEHYHILYEINEINKHSEVYPEIYTLATEASYDALGIDSDYVISLEGIIGNVLLRIIMAIVKFLIMTNDWVAKLFKRDKNKLDKIKKSDEHKIKSILKIAQKKDPTRIPVIIKRVNQRTRSKTSKTFSKAF